MPPDLSVVCACVRGLIHHEEWADPCPVCGGRGSVTLSWLCRRIGENRATMRRLRDGSKRGIRGKTAARIFRKLAELVDLAQGRAELKAAS